jgi:hypothetical protein
MVVKYLALLADSVSNTSKSGCGECGGASDLNNMGS